MQALRFALIRSLLRDPDNVDEREPLWMAFYALRRECGWRLDWLRHALSIGLDAVERDAAGHRHGVLSPVDRPDGSTEWVSSARSHPGLHCAGPLGWLPGDPEPGDPMPADERERMLDLSS